VIFKIVISDVEIAHFGPEERPIVMVKADFQSGEIEKTDEMNNRKKQQ
jgi:hypothetical protein